jgi:hypothetical protein
MAPVVLHLYDLSNGIARQMSQVIIGKQLDGIWHSGIAVFGIEYFYGGGICAAPVGHAMPHQPYQEIALGNTTKTQVELEIFLQSINHRFTSATYSLLRHNCNNFANEVAQFLLNGRGIPEHIIRLPHEFLTSPLGATLAPMIESMESQMRQQLVGGGSALNPFGHIQGNQFSLVASGPTTTAAVDTGTANIGTLHPLLLEGDRQLLKTAVDGVPISIMSAEIKSKVIAQDPSVTADLVDIITKNFRSDKNPILMSFGTICRYFAGIGDFRIELTKLQILPSLICACVKSYNSHVVTTGLSIAVNVTGRMEGNEFIKFKDCLSEALDVLEKEPFHGNSVSHRRVNVYIIHNILLHGPSMSSQDLFTIFNRSIIRALKLLEHLDSFSDENDVKRLAVATDGASQHIIHGMRDQFSCDGIDVGKIVNTVEALQVKYNISMTNVLDLIFS